MWCGQADRPAFFRSGRRRDALVDKFAGARFKSFPTRAEAERAFQAGMPRRAFAPAKPSTIRAPLATDAAKFDVQIYCDGACEPNPGNAGSGMAIYRNGLVTQLWYGLYNPTGTNNTAELTALHQALVFAEQEIATGCLRSDTQRLEIRDQLYRKVG